MRSSRRSHFVSSSALPTEPSSASTGAAIRPRSSGCCGSCRGAGAERRVRSLDKSPYDSRGKAARKKGKRPARWCVMPRSIWKGVMSFGMVAIPVRLYLATESSSKVSFNLLCPEHRSRIKNKRWCVEGDHEVAWGDVVRGYEYEKRGYVTLTAADLARLP